MKKVREVFEDNIKLLGYIDRALIFFRQCRYDKALYMISQTGDGINTLCDAIIFPSREWEGSKGHGFRHFVNFRSSTWLPTNMGT